VRTEHREYLGRPVGWAVVKAQPHRERVAVENLERQGFRTYCPVILRQRRRGRQMQPVPKPLFPGYLFVRLDPDVQPWRPMLSTLGVRTVICSGERPSLIEDAFVEGLKVREHDGVIVHPDRPYQVGQQVRMAGGAFDGLVATVIGMREKDRLTVLLQLLSRAVRVELGAQDLSPV
jgi:transcriptional antiterminator RfaH